MRYQIFAKKLAAIEEQNMKFRRGESSWAAGLNEHSDKTSEEQHMHFGLLPEVFPAPAPAHENHHSHQRMWRFVKL